MRYFILTLLLAVAACSAPPVKMEEGSNLKPGAYKVVAIEVIPAEAVVGTEPGFRTIQPILFNALQQRLTNKGEGTPVWLSVHVGSVQLEVGTAKVLLVGDAYHLSSSYVLMEPQTRKPLGSAISYNQGSGRGGPLGLLVDSAYSQEEKVQALVDNHADKIIESLYPGK